LFIDRAVTRKQQKQVNSPLSRNKLGLLYLIQNLYFWYTQNSVVHAFWIKPDARDMFRRHYGTRQGADFTVTPSYRQTVGLDERNIDVFTGP